jgi:hypothetical protein
MNPAAGRRVAADPPRCGGRAALTAEVIVRVLNLGSVLIQGRLTEGASNLIRTGQGFGVLPRQVAAMPFRLES